MCDPPHVGLEVGGRGRRSTAVAKGFISTLPGVRGAHGTAAGTGAVQG